MKNDTKTLATKEILDVAKDVKKNRNKAHRQRRKKHGKSPWLAHRKAKLQYKITITSKNKPKKD